MKPFPPLLLLSFLLSSFLTPPPLFAGVNGTLSLDNGQISAHLTATPLDQVLEQFSSISGVPVRWLNGKIATETVSVEFTHLPLSRGLQKILAKQDFMLFYSSDSPHARLTEIWITNKGDEQSQGTSSRIKLAEPAASMNKASQEEDDPLREMQPEQLSDIALENTDPMLREKAITYLEAHAHTDQRAFDALTRLAQQATYPEVQELATEALQQFE